MGSDGSLFAAARTIRDIGSYLPVDLGGEPYDREEHRRASQAWSERSQAPLPPSVESPEFFNNGMADEEILALEISPERVRVTVDLGDAQSFVSGLCAVLDLPWARKVWPVDLVMDAPSLVPHRAHEARGVHHDVVLESQSTQDSRGVGALADEWFFAEDGRLGWVAETYGLATSSPSPSVMIHLLVECRRAFVVDHRAHALTAMFGPAAVPLWEEALCDFVDDGRRRAFWLPHDLEDWLPVRRAARGLTRADFLLPSEGA